MSGLVLRTYYSVHVVTVGNSHQRPPSYHNTGILPVDKFINLTVLSFESGREGGGMFGVGTDRVAPAAQTLDRAPF